jgi:hypothetical protein
MFGLVECALALSRLEHAVQVGRMTPEVGAEVALENGSGCGD